MSKSMVNKYLILGVLGLALILRLLDLTKHPESLSMDEVTFGYSSYSILKTGKDENGKTLPLTFRGMGDYKPPVDVYLKVPFIKLFGLTEFGVRLPGVIIGVISVGWLYLWLKEIGYSFSGRLFASFWLAVSGWHIFLSRAGFEAITALFFLLLGLYLVFKAINTQAYFKLALALVSFSLAAWSYHAERIYIPSLFLGLIIILRDKAKIFLANKKSLLVAFVPMVIFALPFLYLTIIKTDVRQRAMELWITKSPDLADQLHTNGYQGIFDFVMNNDMFLTSRYFLGQYLKYYDLKLWFWKGLGLTPAGYPDIGLLYIVDLPVVVLGIYWLIKAKNSLHKKLGLLFFVLGGFPGAFARGEASHIRALVFVPFFGLIFACAGEYVVKKVKLAGLGVYILLVSLNTIFFFNLYFNSFHKFYADLWHYGYKQVAYEICNKWNNYDKVILTDKYGLEIPSIKTIPHYYVLFHCKYNPYEYIANKQLYNLEIRQPQWVDDMKLSNTLLIGSVWDFPENFPKDKVSKILYFPNGKPAFYFVETKLFAKSLTDK